MDGNKRTALATCLVFLSENKLLPKEKLNAGAGEKLVLDVAATRLKAGRSASSRAWIWRRLHWVWHTAASSWRRTASDSKRQTIHYAGRIKSIFTGIILGIHNFLMLEHVIRHADSSIAEVNYF